ncbi:ATP-binding cassette domain-containing protein [Actinokineospora iranica]|uniref:ABC-2 type transport system ATP-binding protein n=1 Tax=Actinokineospora iranica TaxID=1271860 RepID=A0A1G6Q1C2_9PSEU|nr:ATP-binding cassette domain-containing protein [Actinokineospora iranica]SDC85437.1 ABC-2 type transport system ATP-binding protein [Actinokineospora iranica]
MVENVGFTYGRKQALSDVNWAVDTGITGLLGPNGAGKTTLLNLLAGLAKPTTGRIVVDDTGRSSSPRVGFVPQRFSLAGEMKVRDTVAYAAWVNGVPRKECPDASAKALAAVQLDEFATSRVRSLSGGQRQRLGVAAALAHEPDILVLDEPTVGLDPGQRLRLREVIADLGSSRTVLLSTHLIEDVSHLCKRVGVLAKGKLVFDGTEAELTTMIGDVQLDGTLGSSFERGYLELINRLGGVSE